MRVLFTYQNMCIMLKFQTLHTKMDFITRKPSKGLAALTRSDQELEMFKDLLK